MNRLKERYHKEVVPALAKQFGYTSVMQAPRIQKVVLNSGIGEFRENREAVDSFVEELANITGQAPAKRTARLSEAGFKIRKGQVVGYMVTLRGNRMWAFLDKFINVALPQVRDFKGLNLNSFDESGNYSVGITEHVIFPEVDANKVKGIRGLQVNIGVKSQNVEQSKALLTELGMPFKKD